MNKSPLRWCAAILLSAVFSTPSAGPSHSGVVLETMDSGGYTYARVDEGAEPFWIAAPRTAIKQGDRVGFTEQMWMQDFQSSSLNRTFDRLLFVGAIDAGSAAPAPVPVHPPIAEAAAMPVSEPIEKAEGGYTVAELFQRKDELKGKTVKVHGRVVKVSKNIMKTNWVHLQDGTGDEATRDIIFRSAGVVPAVGDLVFAEGSLAIDQDFGYGYVYPVLVEEARFSR